MIVRVRAVFERARSSLFWVPSAYVVLALILATVTTLIEQTQDVQRWSLLLFEANAESVRSVLQTVATATITVAGLVFPVMVVALQLASSQFSPRVLRGFLRDRVLQHVLGFVVGTFSFSMIMLASTALQQGDKADEAGPSLAVTLAAGLAVATMVAIVAFIHHAARYMQVVEIIGRTTAETRTRVAALFGERSRSAEVPDGPVEPAGEPARVRAQRDGWVQQIENAVLLDAIPPGGTARVEVRPGEFVVEGQPLVAVWGAEDLDDPDGLAEEVLDAFAFGTNRTMQDDVVFGIRQIVDIALRALSPAINDPTTAYEVTVHLGAMLGDILTHDLPPRVIDGDEDRRVMRPYELSHDDYVDHAFDQLRLSAARHPVAAINVLRTIGILIALLRERGLHERTRSLETQVHLTVEAVERHRPLPYDLTKVRAAAAEALAIAPEELPAAST
ncbi:MAG: DUF2254 domain-containing protein [Actinobacteria bacterium]|nr:DUF2254 domain-containing protein [Actinomycetota bacterium]